MCLTCGDHTEPNLSHRAVDVGGVLDLADVRAVVGELDLLNYDGGVAAHDVAGPTDALPENALQWRIRPLLVVEHLRGGIDRVDARSDGLSQIGNTRNTKLSLEKEGILNSQTKGRAENLHLLSTHTHIGCLGCSVGSRMTHRVLSQLIEWADAP